MRIQSACAVATVVSLISLGTSYAYIPLLQMTNQISTLYNATLSNSTNQSFFISEIQNMHGNIRLVKGTMLVPIFYATGGSILSCIFATRCVHKTPQGNSVNLASLLAATCISMSAAMLLGNVSLELYNSIYPL